MRLLLDTHVVLWWLSRSNRLGQKAASAIADVENDTFVSAVTAVEMSIKAAKGKLRAPDNLDEMLAEKALTPLPITFRHGRAVRDLPQHHGDPFDRILVAQARCEGLTIVTADPAMAKYGVPTLEA